MQVHIYGSAASNLLIAHTNDIDLCLEVGPAYDNPIDKADIVTKLGEVFTEAKMEEVMTLPRVRVRVCVCVCAPNRT